MKTSASHDAARGTNRPGVSFTAKAKGRASMLMQRLMQSGRPAPSRIIRRLESDIREEYETRFRDFDHYPIAYDGRAVCAGSHLQSHCLQRRCSARAAAFYTTA